MVKVAADIGKNYEQQGYDIVASVAQSVAYPTRNPNTERVNKPDGPNQSSSVFLFLTLTDWPKVLYPTDSNNRPIIYNTNRMTYIMQFLVRWNMLIVFMRTQYSYKTKYQLLIYVLTCNFKKVKYTFLDLYGFSQGKSPLDCT